MTTKHEIPNLEGLLAAMREMPEPEPQLEFGSHEWARAWAMVAHYFGGAQCADPATGEVWQYMGTHNGAHEFRHRALPEWAHEHDGRRRVVQTYRTNMRVPVDPAERVTYHRECNHIPRPYYEHESTTTEATP